MPGYMLSARQSEISLGYGQNTAVPSIHRSDGGGGEMGQVLKATLQSQVPARFTYATDHVVAAPEFPYEPNPEKGKN